VANKTDHLQTLIFDAKEMRFLLCLNIQDLN